VIEASLTAVVPAFVRLARHPSAEVRVHAVQLLAGRPDDAAQASVEEALGDADVAVPRAALAALGPGSSARTVRAVAALLAAAPAWSLRVEAAEALGRVADAGADGAARAALEKAARADGYALVREAALRALAVQGRDAAAAVLREARDHDAEPHVRDVARALLE
jgi:HEAT repeat protein